MEMKPLTSHSYFEAVALCCVPVMCVFLTWALWPVHHAIEANSQGSATLLAKLGADLDKVGIALDTVNAPPKDDGHHIVYGTLSGVSQMITNIGILAAQGAEQIKQSGKLVTAAATTITTVGTHLDKTADAVTGSAQATTDLLGTANTKLGPLMQISTETLKSLKGAVDLHSAQLKISEDDFNKVLAGALPIEANVATLSTKFVTTTDTFNHMLGTADKVETKDTNCTLHPHFTCKFETYTMFGAQAAGYLLH